LRIKNGGKGNIRRYKFIRPFPDVVANLFAPVTANLFAPVTANLFAEKTKNKHEETPKPNKLSFLNVLLQFDTDIGK
jgi:hypothetical protein